MIAFDLNRTVIGNVTWAVQEVPFFGIGTFLYAFIFPAFDKAGAQTSRSRERLQLIMMLKNL